MKNKTFRYNELGVVHPITITGQGILDIYFDYWSALMKKVGREHLISEDRCIEDWCAVNWAWEFLPKESINGS